MGEVQQTTGASAPNQLHLHTGVNSQGKETLTQSLALRQLVDSHAGTHGNVAQGHRKTPSFKEIKRFHPEADPRGVWDTALVLGGSPCSLGMAAPGWSARSILPSVKGSSTAVSASSSASPKAPALITASASASEPQLLQVEGFLPQLTVLYDGGCPLCLREVRLLQRRDGPRGRLAFVDINAPDYDSSRLGGISYRQAMGRIHAIAADGTVLRDLEVFRRAYQLVDLGWLYAPTRWPLLRPLADAVYGFWARHRLRWTGRPDLDALCRDRQSCAVNPSPPSAQEALKP